MIKRIGLALVAAILTIPLAGMSPAHAALGPRGLDTGHPFAHFHGTCAHWWVTFGLGEKSDWKDPRFKVIRYWYRDRMPVSQVMHPGDVDTYADSFRHGHGKTAFVEVWMNQSWVKAHAFTC